MLDLELLKSRRGESLPWIVSAASLLVGHLVGCSDAPPPVTDLSKAPWLDPKVQIEGLKDSDMRIAGLSAINLGNIGAPAADAIPELEKLASTTASPRSAKRCEGARKNPRCGKLTRKSLSGCFGSISSGVVQFQFLPTY